MIGSDAPYRQLLFWMTNRMKTIQLQYDPKVHAKPEAIVRN
jgi:hypothetical protein